MCKPNISQRGFHQLSRDTKLDVSYRYPIPVTEWQPAGNANALYASKSRGFGGEIGIDINERGIHLLYPAHLISNAS